MPGVAELCVAEPDVAEEVGAEAGAAGAGVAGADGCARASASDVGSMVVGTVKPNAAASANRDTAPRREIIFVVMPQSPYCRRFLRRVFLA